MDQITLENWFFVSLAVNIIFLGWIVFQRKKIKRYRNRYLDLHFWTSSRLDLVIKSARIMAKDLLDRLEGDLPIDDLIQFDIINAPDEFKKQFKRKP